MAGGPVGSAPFAWARSRPYCLGCCWFLMGLLFFGGVMNLLWIGGLAAFVLLEKTIPMGHWLGRIAGVGVTAWGVLMLVNAAGGS